MAGTIVVDRIESDASYASNINVASQITFSNTSTFTTANITTANITTANIASISGAVVATQANQETATSTTTLVTPGRQQYHPSAAKAWVMFDPAATIHASYNVSSIQDMGTGTWRVFFTNAQSSATFSTVVCAESSSDVWGQVYPAGARTTTYVGVGTVIGSRSLFDPTYIYAQIFGDLS